MTRYTIENISKEALRDFAKAYDILKETFGIAKENNITKYLNHNISALNKNLTLNAYINEKLDTLNNFNKYEADKETAEKVALDTLEYEQETLKTLIESFDYMAKYEIIYKEFDKEYEYLDYLMVRKEIIKTYKSTHKEIEGRESEKLASKIAQGRLLDKLQSQHTFAEIKAPIVTGPIYDDDSNPTYFEHK